MDTETQKQNEVIEKTAMEKIISIASYTHRRGHKEVFPLIEFQNEEALAKFYSCIGFLVGIQIGGNKELAEKLAKTLLRSLWADSKRETIKLNNVRGYEENVHQHIIMLSYDSDMFCFGFLLYNIIESETKVTANDFSVIERNGFKYARSFNGGIIFHGLQRVFTTNLDGSIGWQMHT